MPSGPLRSDGAQRSPFPGEAVGYRLLVGARAISIDHGETILGRGDDCGIVVPHSLVSRRHARILFEDRDLYVEDLGSANGTYLNGARIRGRVPVEHGDRITLGSYELVVLPAVSSDDDEEFDRPTPASGVEVLGQVALSRRSPESIAAETDRRHRTPSMDEELESAGRLADRVFANGRPQAAQQILTDPLLRILEDARHGNLPSAAVVDLLGRLSLRLANATGQGRWVDLAVEVHELVGRPFRAETLRRLVSLQSRSPVADDALMSRYYETLRARLASMDADDRALVSLIGELFFGLEDTD
jgi:pSer/pThr/pTyr-binding forkhead associated (FHA) protein